MANWIEDVLSKWKLEGVNINPPATLAEIRSAESILNFTFPDDFKAFYQQANGFAGLDWQEHMFTLWPLERIVEKFVVDMQSNFIGFCDFFCLCLLLVMIKTNRVFLRFTAVRQTWSS